MVDCVPLKVGWTTSLQFGIPKKPLNLLNTNCYDQQESQKVKV
jgi:hypothetical protein